MDKVRVGLIGTSWWAENMFVQSVRSHPGAELVAVCGTNPERTETFADKLGVPRHFTDHRAMLAAGGLDAVIVASPDDSHMRIALDVIAAGLHILCEKPLALNVADAEAMLAAAKGAKVRHIVLYTWRWQPPFQYLKSLLEGGYVGRVLRAQFTFLGPWALSPTYQWRHDGDRANGVLADLGSHMIDMGQWMVGRIAAVSAHAPRLIDRTGYDGRSPKPTNDVAHLTLEFANGAQGVVDVSAVSQLAGSVVYLGARIDGTAGSLAVDYYPFAETPPVHVRGKRLGEAELQVMPIPGDFFPDPPQEPFGVFQQNAAGARLFIDAIREGFAPDPGFEAGVDVQRVVEAALKSHSERRWISL